MVMETLWATSRTFSMILSKVPCRPRSGRIRLCVSRSPSSVIFTPLQAVGCQPIDDLGREQEAVGDDADVLRDAALLAQRVTPLGQVVGDRQVEQRLTSEQREHEFLGPQRVQTLLDPRHHFGRGLERHLVRELVVIAVVALEAVVAGEITLQCREDRHPQLIGVLAHAGEILEEGGALGVTALARRTRFRRGRRSPRAPRR